MLETIEVELKSFMKPDGTTITGAVDVTTVVSKTLFEQIPTSRNEEK